MMTAGVKDFADRRALASLHVERHCLDNGLRVVLHPVPELPIACINVWYHVGSRNDLPERSGLAHFLEHLLVQGHGGHESVRGIHQAGGTANGSTWYDRTTFFETVPSHALESALWIEANRLADLPALAASQVEIERAVILNERRQVLDMPPYGGAHERLHELLFPPGHPYRRPVMGYPREIEIIRLDDLHAFFHTFYVPQNAVLTVAGDFQPDATLARIDRQFGGIRRDAAPATIAPPMPRDAPGRLQLHRPVDLTRVYLAFRLPAYGDPAWYATDLLAAILAAGTSSALHRELVHRRQWAIDVSYAVIPTEWCATLTLTVVCRPGVDAERVQACVLDYLAGLGGAGLPEAILERSRNRVLTQFVRDLQRLEKRADTLSKLTTYFDDPDLLEREVTSYRRLQAEDLMTAAARHLRPEQAAILTYRPHPPER